MKQYGYKVISCDLIQRDYPLHRTWDFLSLEEKQQNKYSIVMNPPYAAASSFIQKAINISEPGTDIWAFLKIQFLEGKSRRKEIFDNNWLREVDIYTSRVKCAANGDFDSVGSSAVCYAFFRFNNSETTEPIIKWIN